MRCHNCEHVIPLESKFCAYCGVPQLENAAFHYLMKSLEQASLAMAALEEVRIWVPRARNNLRPAVNTIAMVRGELAEALGYDPQGFQERESCGLCGAVVVSSRCVARYSRRHIDAINKGNETRNGGETADDG